MRPRVLAAVLLVASASASSGGWEGALGGIGEAMQRQAEQDSYYEQQRRQFLFELKMREQQEIDREQRAERAAAARAQRDAEARRATADQAKLAAAAQAARIEAAQAERAKQMEQELSSERAEQRRLLTIIHPDWEKIVTSAAFEKWINTLPSNEVSRFNISWDAAYVASVISKYKKRRQR